VGRGGKGGGRGREVRREGKLGEEGGKGREGWVAPLCEFLNTPLRRIKKNLHSAGVLPSHMGG